MFGKSSNKVYDERIEKESNKPAAMMFYVTTVLLVLCMGVKIVCQLPVKVYALEIGCLVISLVYVFANKAKNGILWIKEKDDAITTINNKILAKGFMIDFWMLVFGELVFMLVLKEYFFWVTAYLFIVLVPSVVITILSLKNGWLTWGTKKREKKGLKEFRIRVVIGSLFFGVFMGFPMLYSKGTFHPEGILWILGMGAFWGIFFYFGMLAFIKASESKADKIAREAELDETGTFEDEEDEVIGIEE